MWLFKGIIFQEAWLGMSTSNKHNYLRLIHIKVAGNLVADSSRDYLNYCWWLIEPILKMLAYYFIFGMLLSRGTENYVAFLMTGLIPWLWFAQSVSRSAMSIVAGKALMMQVYIPKIILPTIVICQDAVKHMVIFVPLLLFLFFYGIFPSATWLAIPALLFTQFLVIMAFSYFVAAIVPFMHDFNYMVATGLQLMFFCSGVFYNLDVIPPQFQKWFSINPMAALLYNYRQVLMYHQWPDWWDLLLITSASLFAIFIMWGIIKHLDHIYPRVVL